MNVASIRWRLARVILVAPVALALWWLLLDPLILPFLDSTAGALLEWCYPGEVSAVSVGKDMAWVIKTNFLQEPQPYRHTLDTFMTVAELTLALPLFWSLSAACKGKSRFQNLAGGTLWLLLLLGLLVFMKGIHQIEAVAARPDVLNLYLGPQGFEPVVPPSDLQLRFYLVLEAVLSYLAMLVFPLAWLAPAYAWFNTSD